MKTLKRISQGMALAICLGVSSAYAGGIKCAVDGVLQNSENVTIPVNGLEVTIEPVEVVEKYKGGYTFRGVVHHKDAAGKFHKIAYRVTREKGAIKKIELSQGSGMWFPASAEIMRALGDFTKTGPVTDKAQQEAYKAIHKVAEGGSWQRSAELIIAYMAISHC